MSQSRECGPPRVGWSAGKKLLSAVAAGVNVSMWLTAAPLSMTLGVGTLLAAAVILTALYAPDRYSARAFGLLPWADSSGRGDLVAQQGWPEERDRETADTGRHRPLASCRTSGLPARRPAKAALSASTLPADRIDSRLVGQLADLLADQGR